MSSVIYRAGMRIRFMRTLIGAADEHAPLRLYANHGEGGRIVRVGGCHEGYWVKWDGWPWAAFGCESKDFRKESVYLHERRKRVNK